MLARARAKSHDRGTSINSNGSDIFESVQLDGPVRTCLGCRSRDEAKDLIRMVFKDGVVTPDPRKWLAGRGAYLHPHRSCFDLAVKRRAFGRALRLDQANVDPELVLNHLLVVVEESADDATTRGDADKEGSRSDPS